MMLVCLKALCVGTSTALFNWVCMIVFALEDSNNKQNPITSKPINKMKPIIVIALILVCYVYACAGACTNCGPNDGCCNDLNNNGGNPTCYNKDTHQCNNGNRLCPLYNLSCGPDCYSPYWYACANGQLVNKCVVPGSCGNLACCPVNAGCYNPNHFACTNDGLFVKCFGIASNDPSVCMGHGTCDGLDHCVCKDGYTGNS